jgi:cyclic beta-1,2-glucan synthetase
VIAIILLPPLSAAIAELLYRPKDVMLRQHLDAAIRSTGRRFAQAAFTLATLPYEAFLSLHAIGRTLVRVLVTHTRLLEWNPSGGQ